MAVDPRKSDPRKLVWALLATTAWGGFGLGVAQAQFPLAPVRDPEHIIRKTICTWQELKQQNVVMQKSDYSCGAAALATVIKYYWGDNVTEEHFIDQIFKLLTAAEYQDRVKNGLTLTDLRRAAVKSDYLATIGEVGFNELAESKIPVIVGISVRKYDHFVVYRGTDWEYVYVADPIRGNIRIPVTDFVQQWQKNAVLIVAKDEDPKKVSPLSIRPSELYLGTMNRQAVRGLLSRDSIGYPPPTSGVP